MIASDEGEHIEFEYFYLQDYCNVPQVSLDAVIGTISQFGCNLGPAGIFALDQVRF